MKKERKLKLEMNKVSVSNLNNAFGGGETDVVPSINYLCEVTTEQHTIPGQNCKTYLTVAGTQDRC